MTATELQLTSEGDHSALGVSATSGWYKDAVIYEVHVRAFHDGNGDGVGDFRGLIEKLDYLSELGVTALWLLPFYPSPLRDDGYDISDYRQVHPSYGSLRDFRLFLSRPRCRRFTNYLVRRRIWSGLGRDSQPWSGPNRWAYRWPVPCR